MQTFYELLYEPALQLNIYVDFGSCVSLRGEHSNNHYHMFVLLAVFPSSERGHKTELLRDSASWTHSRGRAIQRPLFKDTHSL